MATRPMATNTVVTASTPVTASTGAARRYPIEPKHGA